MSVCRPTGKTVQLRGDDLFYKAKEEHQIDFENEGGETFICGNPPYLGSKWQSKIQKEDLAYAWRKHPKLAKNSDFVTGWIACFLDYVKTEPTAKAAFVSTNSVCQGQLASTIWPVVFNEDVEISFAHKSFKWSNLAVHNAGVTVVIIGFSIKSSSKKRIFDDNTIKECSLIGPYLIPNTQIIIEKSIQPLSSKSKMLFGNMPRDGGHLILSYNEFSNLSKSPSASQYIKRYIGAEDLTKGKIRFCLWIDDESYNESINIPEIKSRIEAVALSRQKSSAPSTKDFAKKPYRFVQIGGVAKECLIVTPKVSSENRDFLPVDYLQSNFIASDLVFALYDEPLFNLALIASKVHIVWISNVCGKMKTDFRYSNTLGWNTFPVPTLTEKNKEDLTHCAEDILLAREAHFPATIADLYDPDEMPENLREAHERNDEVLERIYIGRRFKNDTERLEKLFELYVKMTEAPQKLEFNS